MSVTVRVAACLFEFPERFLFEVVPRVRKLPSCDVFVPNCVAAGDFRVAHVVASGLFVLGALIVGVALLLRGNRDRNGRR